MRIPWVLSISSWKRSPESNWIVSGLQRTSKRDLKLSQPSRNSRKPGCQPPSQNTGVYTIPETWRAWRRDARTSEMMELKSTMLAGSFSTTAGWRSTLTEDHVRQFTPYIAISASFLWHGDSHAENIFVNPERPSEVLGIMDWQSTELRPLFDHARQPFFLDYRGPQVTGLDPPPFPDDIDRLKSPEERAKTQSLYLNMSLAALCRTLTHGTNRRLHRAMEFRETASFDMPLLAQNLFIDGEALYRSCVIELEKEWDDRPEVQARGNPPFSFLFSPGEVAAISKDAAGAVRGMQRMEELREMLGDRRPEKGIARPDQYEEVKTALKNAKTEMIDRLARTADEGIAWELDIPRRKEKQEEREREKSPKDKQMEERSVPDFFPPFPCFEKQAAPARVTYILKM